MIKIQLRYSCVRRDFRRADGVQIPIWWRTARSLRYVAQQNWIPVGYHNPQGIRGLMQEYFND